jgi:hypothetical protein
MTQQPKALRLAYEVLLLANEGRAGWQFLIPEALAALKEVWEQPEQEPVAWAVFEGWNAHDLYLPQEYDEALKMAGYKGDHAEVKPLYTTPPAAQPAQQEPVAKVRVHTTGGNAGLAWSATAVNGYDSLPPLADETLLYAAAQPEFEFECPRCGHCCPQRQWVGLTKEDIVDCLGEPYWDDVIRKAEAKLKEKNT